MRIFLGQSLKMPPPIPFQAPFPQKSPLSPKTTLARDKHRLPASLASNTDTVDMTGTCLPIIFSSSRVSQNNWRSTITFLFNNHFVLKVNSGKLLHHVDDSQVASKSGNPFHFIRTSCPIELCHVSSTFFGSTIHSKSTPN